MISFRMAAWKKEKKSLCESFLRQCHASGSHAVDVVVVAAVVGVCCFLDHKLMKYTRPIH